MPPLTKRFEEAVAFASKVHHAQTRKGSEAPYLTHLLAVAALVGAHGGDEEQMMAALLHDAIEDQGITHEELAKRFGTEVAGIVVACTEPTPTPDVPWKERKARYIEQFREATPRVLLVAVSDKLDNARSILLDLRTVGPAVWQRFSVGPEVVIWYFRSLLEVFRRCWQHPLIDELERTVSAIERLAP